MDLKNIIILLQRIKENGKYKTYYKKARRDQKMENKQRTKTFIDEKDIMHHLLEEQIAYILVDEERERTKNELSEEGNHHDGN